MLISAAQRREWGKYVPFYRPEYIANYSLCLHAQSLSHVWLFGTPRTVACQAPLSMDFSRQEYWSGLPFPSPGGLPNPGIDLGFPTLQADSLPSELPGRPITTLNIPKSIQLNIKGYLSCFQLCYYENGWDANCLKNNHFFKKSAPSWWISPWDMACFLWSGSVLASLFCSMVSTSCSLYSPTSALTL